MGKISDLEPKKVFEFFEKLCSIPHGSFNIDKISDYLVGFASERGLKVIQDEAKNVIIFKDATPGYEKEEPVILQGHMDMVAVKKPDCDIDLEKDGLRVTHDDEYVYAEGTSLGGDDGIAVAYCLALLDSDDIPHPALEVVITVNEEVGMDGAKALDCTPLKARRMINIDSESEDAFCVSCAGGARIDCRIPVIWSHNKGVPYMIVVGGLVGGHSGEEINKEHGNSNVLMGRLLYKLVKNCDISLCKLEGGLADNAIPRETVANVLIKSSDIEKMEEIVADFGEEIRNELGDKDPDVTVTCGIVSGDMEYERSVGRESLRTALSYMNIMPNGVISYSAEFKGLPETSLNMGILKLDDCLCPEFSVRSSVGSAKDNLLTRLSAITEASGGSVTVRGEYPGWQYRKESPLRDKMVRIYKEVFGHDVKVEVIHAGLECGVISSKIDDFDCVSIGPNMLNIHTTEEHLDIASTKRMWEFLLKVLQEKD